MSPGDLRERLRFAELDESQLTQLAGYVDLVMQWNRRINLTATRDPVAFVEEHVADCLDLLPHIPPTARTLLDVGAGAGLPGLILAIARPALAVTLLEPVHKKHAFLQTARRELGLSDRVQAFARRLEDHRGSYDVCVSRATWAIPDWLTRATPYAASGGTILAMEGKDQHPLPPNAVRQPIARRPKTRSIIVLDVPRETPT